VPAEAPQGQDTPPERRRKRGGAGAENIDKERRRSEATPATPSTKQ
jgi:hypothetical protein